MIPQKPFFTKALLLFMVLTGLAFQSSGQEYPNTPFLPGNLIPSYHQAGSDTMSNRLMLRSYWGHDRDFGNMLHATIDYCRRINHRLSLGINTAYAVKHLRITTQQTYGYGNYGTYYSTYTETNHGFAQCQLYGTFRAKKWLNLTLAVVVPLSNMGQEADNYKILSGQPGAGTFNLMTAATITHPFFNLTAGYNQPLTRSNSKHFEFTNNLVHLFNFLYHSTSNLLIRPDLFVNFQGHIKAANNRVVFSPILHINYHMGNDESTIPDQFLPFYEKYIGKVWVVENSGGISSSIGGNLSVALNSHLSFNVEYVRGAAKRIHNLMALNYRDLVKFGIDVRF
ncbi:MAG: hypothetical protein PHQ65_15740 [Bacteroidales bacterium]|nr:hypothetical protein [Bacteroidales bacterium]MDD3666717.1 hypothetical protein [Bacteroidales bacterium]